MTATTVRKVHLISCLATPHFHNNSLQDAPFEIDSRPFLFLRRSRDSAGRLLLLFFFCSIVEESFQVYTRTIREIRSLSLSRGTRAIKSSAAFDFRDKGSAIRTIASVTFCEISPAQSRACQKSYAIVCILYRGRINTRTRNSLSHLKIQSIIFQSCVSTAWHIYIRVVCSICRYA